MIRPFTCVCMLLAGASGLYLYQSKHRAHLLDREIMRTIKASDVVRERIGVLRADYANLTEPERLAALSHQHLGLKTLQPGQFVPPAELANRLPAPLPPGATTLTDEEPVPMAQAPVREAPMREAPAREAARPAARPAVPPTPPAQVAAVRPPAPPTPSPAPASVQVAALRPPAPPVPARRPEAAPAAEAPAPRPQVQAPVVTAFATPMAAPPAIRPPVVQRVTIPAPAATYAPEPQSRQEYRQDYRQEYRPAPIAVGIPAVTSALGSGRASLPPPVPVAR